METGGSASAHFRFAIAVTAGISAEASPRRRERFQRGFAIILSVLLFVWPLPYPRNKSYDKQLERRGKIDGGLPRENIMAEEQRRRKTWIRRFNWRKL
jgi:hypothetical protein